MANILSLKRRIQEAKEVSKRSRGATLIELLLYMGILMVFMGVLSNVFTSGIDIQLESQATTSVDRDAHYLFSRLAYDIHRAQSIVTPGSYGTTSTTLVMTISGQQYTYALDSGGNLTYANTNGTFTLNSYDTTLSNLQFTKIGNVGGTEDTIRVSFTLISTVLQHKGTESKAFQTTIAKRKN
jgi:hypothetical protein